jgi:hypothetical protein
LFVVLFSSRLHFNVFPFLPSKSKLIGDVLMNRQRGSLVQVFFSLLQRALPIDAPYHPALLGDRAMLCEQKKIREIA